MHEDAAVNRGRLAVAAVWTAAVLAAVQVLATLVPALAATPGGAMGGAVAAIAAVVAACWLAAGRVPVAAVAGGGWHAAWGRPLPRGVPRHRDPDAAGRARPRAPSMGLPAA